MMGSSNTWSKLLACMGLLLFMQLPHVLHQVQASSMNVCWRRDPRWTWNRMNLAKCSVGFLGKMMGNVGSRIKEYRVTTPEDEDPINPRPGSLRYGACLGHRWITFQSDMVIKLKMPLLVSSFTAIDGRGVNVHIGYGPCILLRDVSNVIVHGLRIHHCYGSNAGQVMAPGRRVIELGNSDGDAIAMFGSSKIWIDHNTLYKCQDGLIDATRGSTAITISNNWFRNHVKVMLLGHDDSFAQDRNMRVTVAFNRFGPKCFQKMPRVRHGYAHVVNNYYQSWVQYAIGGSAGPTIRSEGNLFFAPRTGSKQPEALHYSLLRQLTWREGVSQNDGSWNWISVKDVLANGAYFTQSGKGAAQPNYKPDEAFPTVHGKSAFSVTRNAGVLRCMQGSPC